MLQLNEVIVVSKEKIFQEYNEYHDRGMVKWLTAFALGELVTGIEDNRKEALKDIPLLPQQSLGEITSLLQEAAAQRALVSLQRNTKDELGRTDYPLEGLFTGLIDHEGVYIDETHVDWPDIRNVKLIQQGKWSDVYSDDRVLFEDTEEHDFNEEFTQDIDWME